MYVVTQIFGSISQYFTFTDCLFFGAIISATDPSKKKTLYNPRNVNKFK